MINLHISLKAQNRNIYQLDSLELGDLIWMADSATNGAKTHARSLLEFAYDFHYCNCQYISDTTIMKSSAVRNDGNDEINALNISANPNPASLWVQFYYKLPYDAITGDIIITDIAGKFVYKLNISGNKGVELLDTRNIPNGTYLYTLSSFGFTSTGKLIISK